MNASHLNPDVLIIGAGPSGSCAASMLARAGYSVVVIEKLVFPRFSIGESLLPQCMELLEEAGLLEAVHDQNYQIKKGAIFRRGNESCIINFSEQSNPSYDYTYQVPRAHFDQVLATQAEAHGATFLFNHGCVSVDASGDKPQIEIEDSDGEIHICSPRFLFDASGYGHVLPRLLGLSKPTGFKIRTSSFAHVSGDPGDIDCAKDYIVLSINQDNPNVWYWTIPFSNDRTSFGVVAESDYFDGLPSDPHERIRAAFVSDPATHKRLENTTIETEPGIITGFAHAVEQMIGKNYAILGHSGKFLDPIFSSGVTISLKSAVLAAQTLIREFSGESVNWQEDYSDELNRGVDVFETYVQGWYDGSFQPVLFSNEKDAHCTSLVCSILAGYVWDRNNSLAVKHKRGLELLAEICT